MPYGSTKRLICMFKAKIPKGGYLLPHLGALNISSRQFLTIVSTFPYSSKNYSAEHIHALSTCLTLINTLTHIDKHTHLHTHTYTQTHTHKHTHTHKNTYTHTLYISLSLELTHPALTGICIKMCEYDRLRNF